MAGPLLSAVPPRPVRPAPTPDLAAARGPAESSSAGPSSVGPSADAPLPAAGPGVLAGLRYGLLGLPLAFAALPLYVLLPEHYAGTLGVPLAGLGAVLLGTRALDAFVDPWLGRVADAALARPRAQVLAGALAAAVLMALGFAALFLPPVRTPGALLAWCAGALVVTCFGYSALGVLHQAWGTRLGGGAVAQARITGWREGLALAGVLTASVLPALAGVPAMVGAVAVLLVLALWALSGAPYRQGGPAQAGGVPTAQGEPAGGGAAANAALASPATPTPPPGVARQPWATWLPWRTDAFRRLLAVFMLNGVASAVPATLVVFFIRDRLQAPAWEPAFLGAYFAAAALSMPLWLRVVARVGLVRTWLAGMALAIVAFVGAVGLQQGNAAAFLVICVLTGIALGADLAAPGALLTGVIQRAGHGQRHEGLYVGWWACATKLNLALAAGLALPALQALGYQPGSRDGDALLALALVYAALPCLLKLLAATLLWQQRRHLDPDADPNPSVPR